MKPGTVLGPYEILEPLGEGGMGAVYRARDRNLRRDVALKLLPREMAGDRELLGRLEREARSLAALNHPHIATVHGFERRGKTSFIVMELVEGTTLAEALRAGALPVEQAVGWGVQIAQALEAAHRQGIVHRDLKPGNVAMTHSQRVKVLDFGLAKRIGRQARDLLQTEPLTTTMEPTQAGTILGTLPYMSPEQARGEAVDTRTDIWAFGCVLYEMLTGERAFGGESAPETLASILEREPDWDRLPGNTPWRVRDLLERCLRKDSTRRMQHAGDVRIQMEEALEEPTQAVGDRGSASRPPLVSVISLAVALAIGVGLALVAVALWRPFAPTELPSDPTHVNVNLPADTHLWGGDPTEAVNGGDRPSRTALALTPDGRSIVYAATDGEMGRLYLRRLQDPQAIAIAGTEGGSSPFLSPDGRQVGFFVGSDLRVVPIEGGTPRTVLSNSPSSSSRPYGVSWTDDWIVFAARGGIYRVAASGGSAQQLTEVRSKQGETVHLQPELLPGGNTLLYTVARDPWLRHAKDADIVALSLDGESEETAPAVVVERGMDATYLPSGHLLFGRQGVLMAAAFDPERVELSSEPVEVVRDVMQAANAWYASLATGAMQLSLSESGALLYASGGVHTENRAPPVWMTRDGEMTRIRVPDWNTNLWNGRISPSGRKVAYIGPTSSESDVMVLDLDSGGIKRLELPGTQRGPSWSPDGTRLAFSSDHHGGAMNLYRVASDLEGELVRLSEADVDQLLSDWSVEGVLTFVRPGDDGGGNIGVLESEAGNQAHVFVGGPGAQLFPTFSPDGRWLAYTSNESGRSEIYVRPYPDGDPVYQVTREGGIAPVWSRDGRELFFRTGGNDRIMSVPIEFGDGPRSQEPRELFDRPVAGSSPIRSYDVAPDGRFLMVEEWSHPPQPVTELQLVTDWLQELERRVPSGD